MPPIQPLPVEIDEIRELIYGPIGSSLRLFKTYHQLLGESVDFKNIIVYEDMIESGQITLTYKGQTKFYNIDSLPPRVQDIIDDNGNKKTVVEKKMNYGDYAYEDYFTNSHIVANLIKQEINNIEKELPGFQQTLEKLGVIY
jgi:hypothetical protein